MDLLGLEVIQESQDVILKLRITDICDNFKPYICKRGLADIGKYHDKKLPICKNSFDEYEISLRELSHEIKTEGKFIWDLKAYYPEFDEKKDLNFNCAILEKPVSGTVETEFFKIRYKIYIGCGGRCLAILFNCKLLRNYYIDLCEESEMIDLTLTSDIEISGDEQLFFARKYTDERDEIAYNCFAPIKLDNASHAKLQKQNLLFDYCRNDNEIWDAIVIAQGIVYRCTGRSEQCTDFFEINDSFKAKICSNENHLINILIKENSNKNQNKISIAILGSCYTRECFHSIDYLNPDYKRFYEVSFTNFHTSLISLMSEPVVYDKEKIEEFTEHKRVAELYADMEFSKTFFDELSKSHPDYLIIDLYSDANCAIYQTENKSFITENFYLKSTELLDQLPKLRRFSVGNEQRFEMFKNSVIRFREEVQKYLPLNHIILVMSNSSVVKSENGELSEWKEAPWIKFSNRIWERNDDCFISQIPECRIINMREKDYISLKESPLTFSRNHFTEDYYKDLLNKINKIVLQDLIINR